MTTEPVENVHPRVLTAMLAKAKAMRSNADAAIASLSVYLPTPEREPCSELSTRYSVVSQWIPKCPLLEQQGEVSPKGVLIDATFQLSYIIYWLEKLATLYPYDPTTDSEEITE